MSEEEIVQEEIVQEPVVEPAPVPKPVKKEVVLKPVLEFKYLKGSEVEFDGEKYKVEDAKGDKLTLRRV